MKRHLVALPVAIALAMAVGSALPAQANGLVGTHVTTNAEGPGADDTMRAKVYTVRKGDTLWSIAVWAYGGTQRAGQQYRKIMSLNHLQSTTIRVGQKLNLR